MPALRYGRQASTLAAWGLGQASGSWWHDAACTADPDLFSAEIPGGNLEPGPAQTYAVHICRHHCPVLDQCRAETRKPGQTPSFGVQAGLIWVVSNLKGGRPAAKQPADIGCGHHCADLPTAARRG